MSPTFLYLGNPEELRDGVGDIFARKIMIRSRISKPFLNRSKLEIFKIIDF